jgi:alkylation response protein AidB-like acyl-CoA dehydrogenase
MTAEQRQIVDSVAGYLTENLPVERLRPNAGTFADEAALWPEMAGLGWFMLALPEKHGGLGLTATEEALVFREFGRHLLGPRALATVIAARVAAAADDSAMAQAIASGEIRAALANPVNDPQVGAAVSGHFHVFDGSGADVLVVVAEDGRAALVERAAIPGIRLGQSAVDGIVLEVAALAGVPALAHVGPEAGGHVVLRLLGAAILSGICEGTRDLATEYAKVREQFGRPIGAFQAIKHKCSDMVVRADAAVNLVNFAAVSVAGKHCDAEYQATAAKLLAGRYALLSAKETIQVHGGMGFTIECNAHHFFKRAHLYDLVGGNTYRQQQLLMADALVDAVPALEAAE